MQRRRQLDTESGNVFAGWLASAHVRTSHDERLLQA